jgi:hypothetical protein
VAPPATVDHSDAEALGFTVLALFSITFWKK